MKRDCTTHKTVYPWIFGSKIQVAKKTTTYCPYKDFQGRCFSNTAELSDCPMPSGSIPSNYGNLFIQS